MMRTKSVRSVSTRIVARSSRMALVLAASLGVVAIPGTATTAQGGPTDGIVHYGPFMSVRLVASDTATGVPVATAVAVYRANSPHSPEVIDPARSVSLGYFDESRDQRSPTLAWVIDVRGLTETEPGSGAVHAPCTEHFIVDAMTGSELLDLVEC